MIIHSQKMSIQEIRRKIKEVKGIGGMSVNERLYASGLIELFDKVKLEDKALAKTILKELQVDEESIRKILF